MLQCIEIEIQTFCETVISIYGLKESEELTYRLNGKLRVSGNNILPTTLPFESEGQVTLKPSKDQP